jgi:hypothetical protein
MPPMTGVPLTTSNPADGTTIVSENALALMRWHPWQWQAIVSKGGWVMRTRTRPQRQPPSQGRAGVEILFMSWLPQAIRRF